MTNTRSLSILGCVIGAALLIVFQFGSNAPTMAPNAAPAVVDSNGGPDQTIEPAAAQLPTDSSAEQRIEVLLADEPWLAEGERAPLIMAGRVTDRLGNPIAGASVQANYRRSFSRALRRGGDFGALFRNGSENRDRGLAQLRDRFRSQPLSDAVTSAADGSFQLHGEAYQEASLTIAAAHHQYAPTVVRREWNSDAGELRLADIVLDNGIVVDGVVRDDAGTPIVDARVGYDSSRGFGRGGRSGFGRFNGRGGRNGFGSDDELLAKVIGEARTAADGSFRLGPVPADAFQLRAEAEHHLDGTSERLRPDENATLPLVEIVLAPAAGLSGVVRSAAGQPVANATVTGELSRLAGRGSRRGQRGGDDNNGG